MELEKQVCSIELAKRLEKLGVKQESFFEWVVSMNKSHLRWKQYMKCDCEFMETANCKLYYSAFTVAELGEIFPLFFTVSWQRAEENGSGMIDVEDQTTGQKWHSLVEPNEADARANMLIYLLENKLITL